MNPTFLDPTFPDPVSPQGSAQPPGLIAMHQPDERTAILPPDRPGRPEEARIPHRPDPLVLMRERLLHHSALEDLGPLFAPEQQRRIQPENP
jgi:hypothetical protein